MRMTLLTMLILSTLFTFAQNDSSGFRVTLLGTGDPQPLITRFGPSILVQAGNENLLFDAGRGCMQRLNQLKIAYKDIDALFLTHLHSDHTVGLPDLWLTGWLLSRRSNPLEVFGPIGTQDMIRHLENAYAFDIDIRIKDDKSPPEECKFSVIEIKEGVVYEKNGVKVTAFLVDHFPVVPAFGFRIDYRGHSVVLSGDTRYSENLVNFAKGADLLVHEVVIAPDTIKRDDPKYNVFAHHTPPELAAKVFNQVQPKLAVYSHITKLYGRNEEELLKRTKAFYAAPFIIGEDLMSFTVGDSVIVNYWQKNP